MIETLVTARKALVTATKLLGLIDRYSKRNTESFLAARDEIFRDWVVELANAMSSVVEHLQSTGYRLDEIEARAELPELCRILDNYAEGAWREPLRERRRMFAYASAGSVTPALTLAQAARVERTLRELDPEDVVLLHELVERQPVANSIVQTKQTPHGLVAYQKLEAKPVSGYALVAAGCLIIHTPNVWDAKQEAHPTPVARLILGVLHTYLAVLRAGAPSASEGGA